MRNRQAIIEELKIAKSQLFYFESIEISQVFKPNVEKWTKAVAKLEQELQEAPIEVKVAPTVTDERFNVPTSFKWKDLPFH